MFNSDEYKKLENHYKKLFFNSFIILSENLKEDFDEIDLELIN